MKRIQYKAKSSFEINVFIFRFIEQSHSMFGDCLNDSNTAADHSDEFITDSRQGERSIITDGRRYLGERSGEFATDAGRRKASESACEGFPSGSKCGFRPPRPSARVTRTISGAVVSGCMGDGSQDMRFTRRRHVVRGQLCCFQNL